MITLDQLRKIMPRAGARADRWLEPLNAAMAEFGIDTQRRISAFLAQAAQCSAGTKGEAHHRFYGRVG